MKMRGLLLLIVIVAVLAACGQNRGDFEGITTQPPMEEPEYPPPPAVYGCIPEHQHFWITGHLREAAPGGISFVIENFSDTDFVHNGGFRLYGQINGNTAPVEPLIEDVYFTDEGFIIPANTTTDLMHINWSWAYGELPYGRYWLDKTLHCACGIDSRISMQFLIAPPSPPVAISDFGRAAAKEFLSQFPSIFSMGFRQPDGSYHRMTEPPLVSVVTNHEADPWRTFYDHLGNIIGHNDMVIESNFSLYDLDNDGIPEIIIRRGILETCAVGWDMYRFVNGQFLHAAQMFAGPGFFYDDNGQLIVLYNDTMLQGVYGYYYLTFEGDSIQHQAIPDIDTDWQNWDCDHPQNEHFPEWGCSDCGNEFFTMWTNHHNSNEFIANPTIFGTDRALVAIRSQSSLEAELSREIYYELRRVANE
jgi:hypothetical protein